MSVWDYIMVILGCLASLIALATTIKSIIATKKADKEWKQQLEILKEMRDMPCPRAENEICLEEDCSKCYRIWKEQQANEVAKDEQM